ncbi:MAG: hypothetical protein KIS87_13050 [Phycisphaeraceae bacterium]|nr:hypothetical protein [Phycisphaeraceae bacterium]
MVALTQQEKQVVELFRRLDPGRRRLVLLELVRADSEAWKRYQGSGEARLRDLARDRGLDWDTMDEQARQDFVEDLVDGDAA